MARKICIVGGYGNTGSLIAKLLAHTEGVAITIAGRNVTKADSSADELNRLAGKQIASGIVLDARDKQSVMKAFAGHDLVVVASSTSDETQIVAEAAIRQGLDYMDTQIDLPAKWKALRKLAPEIENNKRLFVTGCGFHPGLPPVMIKFAAEHMDNILTADIASVFRLDWDALEFSKSTSREMVTEFRHYKPEVFQNGQWVKASMSKPVYFDFGDPFGTLPCTPMGLEEMKVIPKKISSLLQTGFHVAGFNPGTDKFVVPFVYVISRLTGRIFINPLARMLEKSLRKHSRPPYGTILLLKATGRTNGEDVICSIRIAHQDAYAITAIPAVSCIKQYLEGRLPSYGLWHQGSVLDPELTFGFMKENGVDINFDIATTNPG